MGRVVQERGGGMTAAPAFLVRRVLCRPRQPHACLDDSHTKPPRRLDVLAACWLCGDAEARWSRKAAVEVQEQEHPRPDRKLGGLS